jgi:nitronate monooxygenase
MISTRFTQLLGLKYPIMSAPMTMHSGGRLAAAVSTAGALGSFGGLHPQRDADWLLGEITHIRQATTQPFGVGFITEFIPAFTRLFDAAMEAQPPVVSFSFGDPGPWVPRAKAAGATVMCQVQTMAHARQALSAGADILVAQGNEAGGHTGHLTLLSLLARLVDAFPGVTVLAAGGIASGRTLASALAAGAEGACLGTALLATPEADEVSDAHKQRVVYSDGEDTVYTKVFDIIERRVFGMRWPDGIASRVFLNRFAEEWHQREHELQDRLEDVAPAYIDAMRRRDPEMTALAMGQSAAFVNAIRPVATVIQSISEEAERIIRERWAQLIG